MSDQGEKTCPLCAEVMDLTDRQLKPCKCGYEICVWCWNHIMEMAEKDNTEGRCPACRTPYDKKKIVGTTATCERLVAEINMEKKKSQKTKPKSSEGRKQLSNFRVVQRNLVYIMGLPLHLGDEDLLHRREYFGQYGKVLKVSMSRTAGGVIQQFPNSTCSVYITYSKEDEAICCIQSVHGYTLEGRPLRACFGTTKYCHAWLRNMPCSNPECLYLHEIGSQEDSFTKDDVISAYTRSRLQQMLDPANTQQRRSGNVLPPPLDDYSRSASAGKPIIKTGSSNVTTSGTVSPPNGSSERAIGLPPAASWAARASNSQPPAASLVPPNGLMKQKSDATDSRVISSAGASIAHTSSPHSYIPEKPTSNYENNPVQSRGQADGLKPFKHYNGMDHQSTSWDNSSLDDAPTADADSYLPSHASKGSNHEISLTSKSLNSIDQVGKSSCPIPEDASSVSAHGHMDNLCSEMSAMGINLKTVSESSDLVGPGLALCENGVTQPLKILGLQPSMMESYREFSSSSAVERAPPSISDICTSSNQCDWMTDSQNQATKISPEIEEDILFFNKQRLKDPEVMSRPSYISNSSKLPKVTNHSGSHSLQYSSGDCASRINSYPLSVDNEVSDFSSQHVFRGKLVSNQTPDQSAGINSTQGDLMYKNDGKEFMGVHQRDALINSNASLASGENSIISDILSLDFDPWDESSPQNLAKWLGDSDMRHDPLNRISKSLKVQNNQSRFSFARQEEPVSQPVHVGTTSNVCGQISEDHAFSLFTENRNTFMDNFGFLKRLSSNSNGEPVNLGSDRNAIFPNNFSASRFPVSAPPGFSVPSRLPPPGFSQERVEEAYSLTSGNHLLDASSLLRNSYQTSKTGSIGNTGDIFTDSANREVFRGRHSNGLNNLSVDRRSIYPQQPTAIDNEARLPLLLQRSISQQQNSRYSDIGDNYSVMHDSYGSNSRLTDQPQGNNLSPFAQMSLQQSRNSPTSNGNWDGWNEVSSGNSLGLEDHRINESLGFNKFYSGYETREFRIPCSGDSYNRTFGM